MSLEWGQLSSDDKQQYEDLAKEDRERYRLQLEEFEQEETQKPEEKIVERDSEDEGDEVEDVTTSRKEETSFDKTLKESKLGRKKFAFDDETVELMINSMFADMEKAYQEDMELLNKNEPALNKLKTIEKIVQVSTKKQFCSRVLDEGFLRKIKEWLKPLPDSSLPNPSLRAQLYELLKKVCTYFIFSHFL